MEKENITAEDLARHILDKSFGNVDTDAYDVIKKDLGMRFIVETKHELGLGLEQEEIDFLFDELAKKDAPQAEEVE